MLGGFVKLMVYVGDTPLAVVVIRPQRGGTSEKQGGAKRRRRKNGAKTPRVQLQLHRFPLVAAAQMACGEKFGKQTGKYNREYGEAGREWESGKGLIKVLVVRSNNRHPINHLSEIEWVY